MTFDDSSSAAHYQHPYFTAPTSTVDSIGRDVQNLSKRLKRLEDTVKTNHKIINNKLNLILDHFLKNAPSEPEHQQPHVSFSSHDDDGHTTESEFAPKPIDSRENFDDIEKNLKNFNRDPSQHREFGVLRRQMVKYYARRLSNVNNRTDPKNGLMHSLMCLYFDKEFLTTIGWTAVGGEF
jgi:hypothetical protein